MVIDINEIWRYWLIRHPPQGVDVGWADECPRQGKACESRLTLLYLPVWSGTTYGNKWIERGRSRCPRLFSSWKLSPFTSTELSGCFVWAPMMAEMLLWCSSFSRGTGRRASFLPSNTIVSSVFVLPPSRGVGSNAGISFVRWLTTRWVTAGHVPDQSGGQLAGHFYCHPDGHCGNISHGAHRTTGRVDCRLLCWRISRLLQCPPGGRLHPSPVQVQHGAAQSSSHDDLWTWSRFLWRVGRLAVSCPPQVLLEMCRPWRPGPRLLWPI